MLSWLRHFPHDVVHRKENAGSGGRRTSSSTTWRNRSSSFTARIIRCASSVVDATANNNKHRDEDDDCPPLPLSPPDHQVDDDHGVTVVSAAQAFSFRELAEAAGNFRQDRLIGEGGFGRVYKGRLTMPGEQEQRVVAVKQLDRNGRQGNSEFVAEVVMLSMLHHPNLVRLLGYCAEGDQRLLVYEHMALGSLEDHLLRLSMPMLPWRTRMRVAHGAARGLEYLHDRAVIYRDLKSSNILLAHDYTPKLSDFGLARLLPMAASSSSSSSGSSTRDSRVMGTYGYCAPEYLRTGKLSAKSDVYSFGVLLLELITGRRAIDATRPDGEQSLVGWAVTMFADPSRFQELVDPRLVMAMQGPPPSELKHAVGVAAMCLQENHALRPVMTDVAITLSFLAASTTTDHHHHPSLRPSDPPSC